MLTVGLDVHDRKSQMCVLDQSGKAVLNRSVAGSQRKLIEELKQLKEPFRVCYEASCSAGWLYDQLTPLAGSVAVAHPGHLRLIFRSKKKNDRIDAARLAKLMYLDEVPLAYIPGSHVRAWRKLIEHRRRLVDKRTRAKNALRALLRSQVIQSPSRSGLWSRKGIQWLKELGFPTSADTLQRDMLVEEIAHFDQQIARVTKELDTMAARHPGVILLKTIPGVGTRTAEAVMAYIDNPKRFTRINKVASYFGMVPTQDQSGSTNRMGHITREGPGTVRKFLVQAAWRGIKDSPSLKAFFDRIVASDKDRRKIALVATAHHVLRVMLSMLRSGAAWEERLASPEDQPARTDPATSQPATPTTPGVRASKKKEKRETALMGGETRPLSPPKPTSLPPTRRLEKSQEKKSQLKDHGKKNQAASRRRGPRARAAA